ncbi:hypothetical protein QQP08_025673 [Theobroma cacao]|nr:hypothetical protein QQP08_025673 [Theobroma cacao]
MTATSPEPPLFDTKPSGRIRQLDTVSVKTFRSIAQNEAARNHSKMKHHSSCIIISTLPVKQYGLKNK